MDWMSALPTSLAVLASAPLALVPVARDVDDGGSDAGYSSLDECMRLEEHPEQRRVRAYRCFN